MVRKNIILLHGWGASVAKLKPLQKNLQKLGWNVLTPKLPGFGTKPPSNVWGLKDYSEHVLNEANKKFGKQKYFLFGHSFGGRIAIKASLSKNKEVGGIVLCASGGISRGCLAKRAVFFVLAKLGKVFLIYPNLAKKFRKLIYKIAREHDYEKSEGIMKYTFRKVIAEDLRQKVKNIVVPTLILWGKLDRMTPYVDALFLEKNIRNSKLISYSDQGHKLPYKKAKDLAGEIEKWYQSFT